MICKSCNIDRAETLFGSEEDPCAYCMQALSVEEMEPVQDVSEPAQHSPQPTKERTAAPPSGAAIAAKELIQRALARKHLLPFVERFNPKYSAGWVHKDIARRLEKFSADVAAKKSPRLMLFMPPRHGKSLLASICFPAWHLGNNPDHEIIACSYSASLAMGFSRKVRNLLREDGYGTVFPDTDLDPDSQSAEAWLTTKAGGYVAAGVSGPITGKGAHCACAGTMVMTESGEIDIKDLSEDPRPVRVLSYNKEGNYLEYRRIEAVSVRKGHGIYRLTTTRGRVVEVTGEHPFWTSEGFKRTDSLSPGDRLMSLVQKRGSAPGVRVPEERAEGAPRPLLLPDMFKSAPRDQEQWTLPYMQLSGVKGEEVLRRLQRERPEEIARVESTVSAEADQVPYVQYRVYGAASRARKVRRDVRENMREADAFATYDGQRQSQVPAREHATARAIAFGKSLPHNATNNSGAGQVRVCGVSLDQGAACTPYRLLADEQRRLEPSDTMLAVSQTITLGLGLEAAEDTVAMVERVREFDTVYDLQIEENHNFFANGTLSSNCLIIDDPVKNSDDAKSDVVKESQREWYASTAYTRLAPGGGILLIMTRWVDDDLGGWLLNEMKDGGEEWEVIKYPAIAEEDELYRDKGEALHPARYDLPALERYRRAVGPRVWSALYQQNPTPDTGDYFTQGMFQFYNPTAIDRSALKYYQAWDLAIGQNDRNDFTVGVTVGIDRLDNMYIVGVERGKWTGMQIVEKILDSYELWKPSVVGIERGHIELAIGPFLEKRQKERKLYEMFVQDLKTGRRDKEARARAIQGRMQQGKVFLPKDSEFGNTLMTELLKFPNGEHDDQVDALAWVGLMMGDFTTPQGGAKAKKSWKDQLDGLGAKKFTRSAMGA